MTCPVCGTLTVEGARFCFACGTSLGTPSGTDVATERRYVTVLFGDLTDFTSWSEDLDPERVGVVIDRVLATLTDVVTEFGGHVDKLTGDGLMAVFGAPVTHEDDAERAVRAAARMQTAVRRVVEEESGGGRRLGLRIGLNTGEVSAGVQAHLTYTVIGDTVNTASRLADAAGVGAVYAGRDTVLATMPIASWRALAPLRLKGKREPVIAHELVGLRPPGSSRLGLGDEAPFVGRDAELGLLIGRLVEVSERASPRVVLVSGEAGVGKTRLGQELSRFAGELPSARVLWGRTSPYGEGRDLAAVAEMVRTACGIVDSDDVDTALARLQRTVARLDASGRPLPPGAAERLRALLGLSEDDVGLPRDPAAPGAAVGGEQARRAVAALFTALAREGTLLLVLDDLHWATPTMLDGLLDVAARTEGPVLLVGLGRPDMLDPPARPAWWEGLHDAELLPVLPLEETAAERLLRAYLGTPGGEVDARVRTALLSRAQGNPFFLAELLHLLVDRGALRRVDDTWVLEGDLADNVLPAGVQSVLAARIDGLEGGPKGVLRDASVLGLRVTLPALEAVGRASGHGDPDVVRAAVAVLVERRLLEGDGDPDAFRFGHTLVRDVAYAGLAKTERARRHAAAAAHASGLGGGRSTEADGVAAAQGERAVHLALEMGLPRTDPAWDGRGIAFAALARLARAALSRDDNLAAESLSGRALRLAGPELGPPLPDDLVVPARLGRAQALAALHRLDESLAELGPALAAEEDGVRAGALVVLGDLRRQSADPAGATRAFVSALAAASAAGLDRVTGEALRQLGLLDYFDGRLRAAESRFREAHELAVQVEDPRGAGWALQHLAWSATTRGDYALADRTLAQAKTVFAELEDVGGLSWLAGTEAFVRLLQGRLREARALVADELDLAHEMGERWGIAALLTIDALAAAELGDLSAGAATAEHARAVFAEVGDAWGQSLALTAAGFAARGAGQTDEALVLLDRAEQLSAGAGSRLTQSLALVGSGYVHLDRRDVDSAEGCAWRACAALTGLDLEPHALLGARVLLAQALRLRGELDKALEELDSALAASAEPALLFPRRQALAHRSGVLLELGLVDDAVAAGQEAVALRSEDVRSQVLALRALGSAVRAAGDRAQASELYRAALLAASATEQRSEIAATQALLDAL